MAPGQQHCSTHQLLTAISEQPLQISATIGIPHPGTSPRR
jgi:hypothetical protein